jgi:hypothetical protein
MKMSSTAQHLAEPLLEALLIAQRHNWTSGSSQWIYLGCTVVLGDLVAKVLNRYRTMAADKDKHMSKL